MVKNIIFDWSGVIKDAVLGHLWIVNQIFKKFGAKEISLEELRENWVQPYMRFYDKYLPDLTIEKEQDAYKKAISECPQEAKPFSGIAELIKKFKEKGIRMAVLSSDLSDTILPEVEKFGLKGVFEEIVSDSHDKEESISGIMKRNNFRPEETIFIGDSNHEVEVGKNNNIKTAAITWGFASEKNLKLANPDFIIHNLKELEEIILK